MNKEPLKIISSVLLFASILLISGCARPYKETKTIEKQSSQTINLLKEKYEREQRDDLADGTIEVDNSIDLLGDYKSDIEVGKTIRIKVDESFKSKNQNQNDQKKLATNTISGGGVTSASVKAQGFLDKTINPIASMGVNTSAGNTFNGKVNQIRNESLNTYITGIITEKISKHLYKIEAKKEIVINNSKKTMLLLGFIHSSNLTSDSEISSNRILNLKIEYKSEGDSEDTVEKGFFQKLMNKIF